MKLCMMTITDGRKECFERTIASWRDKATAPGITDWFNLVVDDSADPEYWEWMSRNYSDSTDKIVRHKERRGFAGAIRSGWANVPADADYVLHLEDDFTLNEPLNVCKMIAVLEANPKYAQVALYRQAWGAEIQYGGYMKQFAGKFKDVMLKGSDGNEYPCAEHRHCFTTNPSIYPRRIIDVGWPEGKDSEGHFGFKLWNLGYYCLLWGTTNDAPRVHHIGNVRVGKGY
jgi:hypothetical protein